MSFMDEAKLACWKEAGVLLLVGATMEYGEYDWRKISSSLCFGRKSTKKCKDKWTKPIKPTITKNEQNKLGSALSDPKFFESWNALLFESLIPTQTGTIEPKLSEIIEPGSSETIEPGSSEMIERGSSETIEPSIKRTELNEEDKELLYLAKLKPKLDWDTIASMIGGTAVECLERYINLLHQTQEKEEREDGTDDPHKLKSNEINANQEIELAQPGTSRL